ncbi:MAG: FkbM family methyltransferase [Rhodobacteraceae bacterium]|nr:FkbM family methyltransferase [Paracoccaceae bacterium]
MNYRPKLGYHGQFSTDVLIELYFQDVSNGNCVEVGAANGYRGSNTLYFENLGWRTLCIEPNPLFAEKISKTRKEYVQCACGSEYNPESKFTVFDIGEHNIMSSLSGLQPDKRLLKTHDHVINNSYEINVEVKTLDSILEENSFSRKIDFISIDTEGTELDVLKGLTLTKWDVSLLVVENNFEDSNISDYLLEQGYYKDARWKINDFYIKGENKYA